MEISRTMTGTANVWSGGAGGRNTCAQKLYATRASMARTTFGWVLFDAHFSPGPT
ncbi:MAG TPA: hypothetical protein PLI95_29920 [Polyangiaceae bacterium]|nr:hypothetical protein [Polyangiaceae bacterium]